MLAPVLSAPSATRSRARESKNWNEFKQNLKRMQKSVTDIQKEGCAPAAASGRELKAVGSNPTGPATTWVLL